MRFVQGVKSSRAGIGLKPYRYPRCFKINLAEASSINDDTYHTRFHAARPGSTTEVGRSMKNIGICLTTKDQKWSIPTSAGIFVPVKFELRSSSYIIYKDDIGYTFFSFDAHWSHCRAVNANAMREGHILGSKDTVLYLRCGYLSEYQLS